MAKEKIRRPKMEFREIKLRE
ncbi:hypothetical protein CCACVL1_16551 [Corchorus capsularis]|uniref:Uncharacterized protein n=1 Tax=Corchorus capsularis TaxID=210143 RepID=A0A1R3HWK8_COCAP|nr:hypothetical protein CCACVL1_16551 [Corchorus capsularis]